MNYEDWKQQLNEAEGFGGKTTPDNNPRKSANAAAKKVLPGKGGALTKSSSMDRLQAIARARRNERLSKGGKGNEGSSGSHFDNKNSSAITKTKPTPSKPKDVMTGTRPDDREPKPYRNNPAKTPDDNVAGAAERLKKKQNDDKSYKNVMKKIRQRKNNEKIAKIKAQRSDGFGAGLKSSLGGDIANRKTDAESIQKKRDAQNKLGRSVGDFMKKAPGRVIGGALKAKTSNTGGTSSSQDLAGPKKGVYNG